MMIDRFKKFVSDNKTILLAVAGILIVVGVIVAIVINIINMNNQSSNYDSGQIQQTVENETQKLTDEIGEQMTLPDEEPTLIIVKDASQQTDEFFKDAKDGDKVLYYEQSGIAVLYRESTKEIIATSKAKPGSIDEVNNIPTGVGE